MQIYYHTVLGMRSPKWVSLAKIKMSVGLPSFLEALGEITLLALPASRLPGFAHCSHVFWETNSLRRTMQIVEGSLLHRRAQGRVSS